MTSNRRDLSMPSFAFRRAALATLALVAVVAPAHAHVGAGLASSFSAGRTGRRENSPPQFGQAPPKMFAAQSAQNVHSKVQIIASRECGGRSLSQHSQFGLSSSIAFSLTLPVRAR